MSSSSSSSTVSFDVGNLAVFDDGPVDAAAFSQAPEAYMRARGEGLLQQLVAQLFHLPSEPAVEGGRVVALPAATTVIPREKPLPKPKAPTRWEEFAKVKGIVKKKKQRMVWDELHEEWRPRQGFKRANDDAEQWAVEHKEGDDPTVDPWTRMARDKKERVAKNKEKQTANALRAASGVRLPGAIDLSSAVKGAKRRRKKDAVDHHVDVALNAVQRSTASMGKFDEARRAEPARPVLQREKVRHESLKDEKSRSLAVLANLVGRKPSEVPVGVPVIPQGLEPADQVGTRGRKKAAAGKKRKRKK